MTDDIAKRLDEMSKAQRSLLLYLETRAVDHHGLIAGEKMNGEDYAIAKTWTEERFINFCRVPARLLGKSFGCSSVVELSDLAWECAAVERKRRATRSQREIVQASLEFHGHVSFVAKEKAA